MTLEEKLINLGVKVKDDKGNYRTVLEIIHDITDMWHVLSENSKNKVRDIFNQIF